MPNHVIRDRIWVSRKLALCSLKAALAYPWLYLIADDWGRFEYQPRVIWAQVFGAREDVSVEDVKNWLTEYEIQGLLARYHMQNDLAYWTGFHGQRKDKRRPSLYPDPKEFSGVTIEVGVLSATITEQNGTDQEQNRTEVAHALIDAYNRVLDCRIGYTTGNVDAAKRGLAHGYTVERAEAVFRAIQARSTQTAKWCAENNHGFEFLTRPPYKHHKTGAITLGPIEKIENELASIKPRLVSESPIERRRRLAEEAEKREKAV